MRFLKNIFLLFLAVIIIAGIYLATLDGSYDIKRSRLIQADQIVVFNELNDFKNWKEWGPWYEQDSTIRVEYSDNTVGTGGAYSWTSDIEGGGSIKTLAVREPERLDQEIVFETPFGNMMSDVYWMIESSDKGTELTWGIKGEMPFLTRFMAADMEEQLGPMEERGLELFDENIQKKLKKFSIDSVGVVDFSGGFYLYLSTSSKIASMGNKMTLMMNDIEKYVEENKIRLTGSPFTIYHTFDEANGTTMFSIGYPIAERIVTVGSDILTGYFERGTYFKSILVGSYENSEEAWEKTIFDASSLKEYTFLEEEEPFEVYVNNPVNTPNPAELITEIYVPVKKIKILKTLETP